MPSTIPYSPQPKVISKATRRHGVQQVKKAKLYPNQISHVFISPNFVPYVDNAVVGEYRIAQPDGNNYNLLNVKFVFITLSFSIWFGNK